MRRLSRRIDLNPSGMPRPQDGRGRGVGMPGGQRRNVNPEPCPDVRETPEGRGMGRGGGRNR